MYHCSFQYIELNFSSKIDFERPYDPIDWNDLHELEL